MRSPIHSCLLLVGHGDVDTLFLILFLNGLLYHSDGWFIHLIFTRVIIFGLICDHNVFASLLIRYSDGLFDVRQLHALDFRHQSFKFLKLVAYRWRTSLSLCLSTMSLVILNKLFICLLQIFLCLLFNENIADQFVMSLATASHHKFLSVHWRPRCLVLHLLELLVLFGVNGQLINWVSRFIQMPS